MRLHLIHAGLMSLLAQVSHAQPQRDVCKTGIYAILSPFKSDPKVKAFCAAKYKPGTQTVTSTSSVAGQTDSTTITTTVSTTSTTTSVTTSTLTTTGTVDIGGLKVKVKREAEPVPAPAPAANKDALLTSLYKAAAAVVTTACSCYYGGPVTTTVIVTTTGQRQTQTITSTETTTIVETATSTAVATETVRPPPCYCPTTGIFCYTNTGGSIGECARLAQDGPSGEIYCYEAAAGCSGNPAFTCQNDVFCQNPIFTGSGYFNCFYSPLYGCNTCGGSRLSGQYASVCRQPPRLS